MGANCCVVAREKTLSEHIGNRVIIQRNVRYSPSWSFRWDNRTHIEDVMDNSRSSYYNSGNIGSDLKNGPDIESEGFSDEGSPLDGHVNVKWQKLSVAAGASRGAVTDMSSESISSQEKCSKFPLREHAFHSNASISITSTHSPTLGTDPSSSISSQHFDVTSSLRGHCSPNDKFTRQLSDSWIHALKKSNIGNSCSEELQSFVLSSGNNELPSGGFQADFSDGWSKRAFSELVACSQRERCSVDRENQRSVNCKTTIGSKLPQTAPVTCDIHTCGLCLKLLKERSSLGNQLAVSAVLACGHVYHAVCLEVATPECDRFDPSCPVCDNKGRPEVKTENKHAGRDAAADVSEHRRRGTFLRIGLNSSLKSSFNRPFLRRYFSIGPSMPRRSLSVSESSSWKMGFWVRYKRGE